MKKAILVGLDYYPKNRITIYMEELQSLVNTLHIDVIEMFTQDPKQSSPQYKVGSGKVEEIKQCIDTMDADLVIFNDELTGSQIRNLENAFDCPVIDRTLLILDIFAKRAKTKEAMLQVEIAQLKYLLPRLTSLHASFEKQQGGIGSRGPGEKKIEMDRRKIEREIHFLKKELSHIVQVRQTNRKHRKKSHIKTVAVVGYTNAGKSTLLNTLLNLSDQTGGKQVHVKDQLFATLETSSRRISLNNSQPFILTDTIGFVSNLPHDLIDSFKSTLEEIQEADLLIHVVDFSNPYYFNQIHITETVLKELNADHIDTLYVFNKIDVHQDSLPHGFTPSVQVSLTENLNIDSLVDTIVQMIAVNDSIAIYHFPYDKGDLVNTLKEYSQIITVSHEETGTTIKARVSPSLRNQLKAYEI